MDHSVVDCLWFGMWEGSSEHSSDEPKINSAFKLNTFHSGVLARSTDQNVTNISKNDEALIQETSWW